MSDYLNDKMKSSNVLARKCLGALHADIGLFLGVCSGLVPIRCPAGQLKNLT